MENQEVKNITNKLERIITGLNKGTILNNNSLSKLLTEIKTDFETLLLKSTHKNFDNNINNTSSTPEKFKEQENLLLTTLYSIGDAVITTGFDGKINIMNPVAEQLTGWKENEAHNHNLTEIFKIINQDTRKQVQSPVERVLAEGVVVGLSNHTLLISKDGKEIPISDSGAPIKDKDGNISGVILVFRDNTKEVEANKLIHESEVRLRRAEIASLSGNWELNLKTHKIIGSKGAQKIYGLNNSSFDYEAIKKIPLQEYRPLLDSALKNLIEKGEPYDLVFKIKPADTHNIKYIHSTAFYDKRENTLFGVIQDITKQKQAELLLMKSEKKYRDLFEKSEDAILIIEDNKFIDCNNATIKMLGYKNKEDFLNLHPSFLSPKFQPDGKSSFEKAEEMMQLAFKNGSYRFEWMHKKSDGKVFPVEVLLTAVSVDGKNKILHTVWRDITKRKQAENELNKRISELERFNKFMTGRELRMIDLKKEVNELLKKLGQPKKYKFDKI